MALYNNKVLKIFKLYKDSKEQGGYNLKRLIDSIRDDKYYIIVDDVESLKNTGNIYFDINNRYIVCYGKLEVYIIPLNEGMLE